MIKINFTKEHKEKLLELAMIMLLKNEAIFTRLGQPITVVNLFHNTSINTLNSMRVSFTKRIETLENEDEWTASQGSQIELEVTKRQKELVYLLIGYKRNQVYLEEIAAKKAKLTKELNVLKESQKTPEDKIKELQEELDKLDS